MLSSTLTLLLATAATITARPFTAEKRQNGTTPAAGSKLIPVVVGGVQDLFIPNRVVATPGDIIQFQFNSGNHTVTQSTAEDACKAMPGGVHSGHIPFEEGQQTVGVFNMLVTNTDTMFLFCATGPHCQGAQVMVVNPANEQQIQDYANRAVASGKSVDGTDVIGGTVGEIPLANAAFKPAPPKEEAAAAPPPPAASESSAAVSSTAAATSSAAAKPTATAEAASGAASVPPVLTGLIDKARRSA